MYGSDDIPVGIMRGKYITFGFAWSFLSEQNHSLSLVLADPRMTFTRYEQLRGMCRAAQRLKLTPKQLQALFHDTAANLVRSARNATGQCPPVSGGQENLDGA
jgi:glutamate-1-semialdehyde 2,1-aminomutase